MSILAIDETIEQIRSYVFMRYKHVSIVLNQTEPEYELWLHKAKTIMSTMGLIHYVEKELGLKQYKDAEFLRKTMIFEQALYEFIVKNINGDILPEQHFLKTHAFSLFLDSHYKQNRDS